jgi:hypothetical protein
MAIELSDITFTEQDDIVPASGVEEIFNTGIVNTLAGNDIITGTGGNNFGAGIHNELGFINTSYGNDKITGIYNQRQNFFFGYAIDNRQATINTGDGDDIIRGTVISEGYGINNNGGLFNQGGTNVGSTINTDDGNNIITGITRAGRCRNC